MLLCSNDQRIKRGAQCAIESGKSRRKVNLSVTVYANDTPVVILQNLLHKVLRGEAAKRVKSALPPVESVVLRRLAMPLAVLPGDESSTTRATLSRK